MSNDAPQVPGPPYGGGVAPVPGYPVVPDHPQAVLILILGILGVSSFAVCAPIAWYLGNKAKAEIAASGGTLGGLGMVDAGRICGIIGTVLLGLAALVVIGAIAVFVVGATASV